MSDIVAGRAPAWLRVIAALAVLWNGYGCYEYLASVGVVPSQPGMSPGAMPAWVIGAFAISVFAGLLGSIGLLLLRRWSKLLLLLSLIALLAQDVWAFVLVEGGLDKPLVLPLAVNLVAILLVWLAYTADRRGWLS